MIKIILSAFGGIVACAIFFWMSLTSSISPDDVVINNIMKVIPATGQTIESQVDKLKLTILLNNKSTKPLFDETKGYFYTIYIYHPPSNKFLTWIGYT